MRAGSGVRFWILFAVCAAIEFAPPRARADWNDFVPRPFENGAFLDLYTSYERDHIRGGGPSNQWTDGFIREKLTLFSDGYSYHPRFMLYHFSISGVLKQEDYGSSAISTPGWQNDTGLEYDIRLRFLPEHVYNVTLYASQYEPLFKEQVATQHNSIETTRGGFFRYREKPYFLRTGYGNDHIDSGALRGRPGATGLAGSEALYVGHEALRAGGRHNHHGPEGNHVCRQGALDRFCVWVADEGKGEGAGCCPCPKKR